MQKKVVKVELGVVQDIEKMVSKLDQLWKSADSKISSIYRTAQDKADAQVKPLVQLRAKLFDVGREFETKADELGLSNADKNKYLNIVDKALKQSARRIEALQEVRGLIIMRH